MRFIFVSFSVNRFLQDGGHLRALPPVSKRWRMRHVEHTFQSGRWKKCPLVKVAVVAADSTQQSSCMDLKMVMLDFCRIIHIFTISDKRVGQSCPQL